MQRLSLRGASEKMVERLFLIMTICLIAPLYFEDIRQIFVLVFFLMLGYLAFNLKYAKGQVSKTEKTWIEVMVAYALVLILSFSLRGNYSDDGSWRLEAPLLMLVFSAWYYFAIRFGVEKKILIFAALSSILAAVILFSYEVWSIGQLQLFQFGSIHRDIGATGFFLPITFTLLCILIWGNRTVILGLLIIIALLFTGLTTTRTAFVITVFPLFMLIIYLFRASIFTFNIKAMLFVITISSFAIAGYFSQGKLTATVSNYQSMEKGEFYTSMGLRVAMLDMGGALLAKNWIIGVGPSDYKKELREEVKLHDYSQRIKNSTVSFMHIHNQYLMDWLLHGLAGIIALGFILLFPLKVFYQKHKLEPHSGAFFAVGLCLGIIVVMFFGALFTYTYTTIMYVLAISALISYFEPDKGKTSC